ncbi:MAG: helix-turn-helix domain-containing protein [Aigarchaeota archaeon]|nr:helix-turn-helix domain-containing protein [Aigarchaeota archaeon]
MPSIRALIAKELIKKYALSQTEVAKIIGTTRSAISQYLSAKRGSRMIRKLRTNPTVRELISRITNTLMKNNPSKESINDMVCEICRAIRSDEYKTLKNKRRKLNANNH